MLKFWINQLRSASAEPRFAQRGRYVPFAHDMRLWQHGDL
jgi:hypothetical protein